VTDNVVEFKRPEPEKAPHLAGDAVCLDCRHSWVAVAEAGTCELTCPKCETARGVWKATFTPRNEYVWVCGCGSDLFGLTPAGAYCVKCGTWPKDWLSK
jgi:hypothetical protein